MQLRFLLLQIYCHVLGTLTSHIYAVLEGIDHEDQIT